MVIVFSMEYTSKIGKLQYMTEELSAVRMLFLFDIQLKYVFYSDWDQIQ